MGSLWNQTGIIKGPHYKQDLVSNVYINDINPQMPREGGGDGCLPQEVFPIFLKNGKSFFAN